MILSKSGLKVFNLFLSTVFTTFGFRLFPEIEFNVMYKPGLHVKEFAVRRKNF